MNNKKNHPVWQVYDEYRTARLNVKFYSYKLYRVSMINKTFEILLAISAPSSAVAGLWFWNYAYGQIAWKYLGILTAFVAVLKPIFSLQNSIKKYEEVLAGYQGLEYDLFKIKVQIENREVYDEELKSDYCKALDRKRELVIKEPEVSGDKSHKNLLERLQNEVNEELPASRFYIPKDK